VFLIVILGGLVALKFAGMIFLLKGMSLMMGILFTVLLKSVRIVMVF